jgi:hypothetical protein
MKRAWIVLACLVGSCVDGIIGEEGCVGVTCVGNKAFQPEPLNINFKEVSTLGARSLPITWTIPNLCPTPCTVAPQLYAAGDDAVWNVPRGNQLPAPELVRADGSRTTQLVNAPSELSALDRLSLIGASDGRLIGHAQWTLPTLDTLSEILVLSPSAPPQLQRVPMSGIVKAKLPPAAIFSDTGYLLFDDGIERGDPPFSHNVLRSVYPDGRTAWQQNAFPAVAAIVAGTAVQRGDHVVIPARAVASGSKPLYGLLWFSASGEVERMNVVVGSSWRSMTLLDRGQDRFVVAAASDLAAAGGSGGTNEGNIDVIAFEESGASNGFRLMRDCFYPLALNGVAADVEGTLYVSSIVGLRDEPRGLLCRLPVKGTPDCFQSDARHSLTAIVALGPNKLIGALDDNLIRIDLP